MHASVTARTVTAHPAFRAALPTDEPSSVAASTCLSGLASAELSAPGVPNTLSSIFTIPFRLI